MKAAKTLPVGLIDSSFEGAEHRPDEGSPLLQFETASETEEAAMQVFEVLVAMAEHSVLADLVENPVDAKAEIAVPVMTLLLWVAGSTVAAFD